MIMREPGAREQAGRQLLRLGLLAQPADADAMSIIEGELTFSEMQVRGHHVPRAQMRRDRHQRAVENFIRQVISTAHSRFPCAPPEPRRRHRVIAGEGPDCDYYAEKAEFT